MFIETSANVLQGYRATLGKRDSHRCASSSAGAGRMRARQRCSSSRSLCVMPDDVGWLPNNLTVAFCQYVKKVAATSSRKMPVAATDLMRRFFIIVFLSSDTSRQDKQGQPGNRTGTDMHGHARERSVGKRPLSLWAHLRYAVVWVGETCRCARSLMEKSSPFTGSKEGEPSGLRPVAR